MADEQNDDQADERKENLKAVYQQICDSYRAIDDSRTKLLGLLPLATGTGILVLSNGGKAVPGSGLSLAVGLFGIVATLGLLSYELHGIKKCAALIDSGRQIETRLNINGQFLRRPQEVAGFIDEPFAASVIYPASLAGWTFFALLGVPARWVAFVVAAAVFVAGLGSALWLIRVMEHDMRHRKQYCKEPIWLRKDRPDRCEPLPDDAFLAGSATPLPEPERTP
jgi:hypothetical protein